MTKINIKQSNIFETKIETVTPNYKNATPSKNIIHIKVATNCSQLVTMTTLPSSTISSLMYLIICLP